MALSVLLTDGDSHHRFALYICYTNYTQLLKCISISVPACVVVSASIPTLVPTLYPAQVGPVPMKKS